MFLDALQNRAHNGDQAAFRDIYTRYSREVYAVSHTALGDSESARTVVKQVFLQLYRELMRAESDLDLAARLSALTNEEIRIMRIASGDLDPESLLVQYTVASAPAVNTDNTMQRIRAHMQQTAASVPAEAPAAAEAEPAPAAAAEPAPVPTTTAAPEPAAAEAPLFAAPAEPSADPTPAPEAVPAEPLHTPEPPKEKKSRRGAVVAGIILVVLLAVFAWLLVGILMDLEILAFYDLGYSLFNEYVFDFFRLP